MMPPKIARLAGLGALAACGGFGLRSGLMNVRDAFTMASATASACRDAPWIVKWLELSSS